MSHPSVGASYKGGNALNRRDFADKLLLLGAQPWPTSPRDAQEFLASEVARWTKLIIDEKIQIVN